MEIYKNTTKQHQQHVETNNATIAKLTIELSTTQQTSSKNNANHKIKSQHIYVESNVEKIKF